MIRYESVDFIRLSEDGEWWREGCVGICVNTVTNKASGSIKHREILGKLKDCQIPMKGSIPCS